MVSLLTKTVTLHYCFYYATTTIKKVDNEYFKKRKSQFELDC